MSTKQKSRCNGDNRYRREQTYLPEGTFRQSSTLEEKVFKEVVLHCDNNVYSISAKVYHVTYDIVQAISKKTNAKNKKLSKIIREERFIGTMTFELNKITAEELQDFWADKTPSIVLKANGRLFHTAVTRHIILDKKKMPRRHLCGGCHSYCKKTLDGSTHIENYAFIKFGYELFGTDKNTIVVYSCTNCS